jgi:signal transduction histidine kinase
MKKIVFIGLMLLSGISVAGQTQKVDSLINVLNTQKLSNKEQISLYVSICINYGHSDFRQLLKYCNEGLKVAEKENDTYNISLFNEMIGFYYESSFKYDTAHIYYNKALDIALKSQDIARESQVYLSLGAMCHTQEQYVSALNYFMEAEKISGKLENKATHVYVLGNIGLIHHTMKNNDMAIPFFEQALMVAEKITKYPKLQIIPTYYLGIICREKKEFDKALEYAQKSLDISRSINEKTDESSALQSIANIYMLTTPPDYQKAMEYADASLEVAEEAGYSTMISAALSVKSNIYKEQKQWKLCEEYAYKAYETDSLNAGNGVISDVFRNVALANVYLGNKEKAEVFFDKFYDYILKSNDKSIHNSISDMEVKYETEKKELQITALEKQKKMYLWLGLAGFLLAIALAIALRQKVKNMKKEKQLVASDSVQDGEMIERERIARDLHDRLGGNLSSLKIELKNNKESMENIYGKLDDCIEEIRRVAHNLMPTSLQAGMKAALEDYAAQFPQVHFHFFGENKRVEKRKEYTVYCCASELVNNSLKHAGADNINLQLVQNDKYITLTVQDDGRGFVEQTVKKGFGLKSIQDRVTSCNGRIDIASSPGNGTETTIEINS